MDSGLNRSMNQTPMITEIEPVTVETTRGPITVGAVVETHDDRTVNERFRVSTLNFAMLGTAFDASFIIERGRHHTPDKARVGCLAFERKHFQRDGYNQFSAEIDLPEADLAAGVITLRSGQSVPVETRMALERAVEAETAKFLAENDLLVDRLNSAVQEIGDRALQAYYRHEHASSMLPPDDMEETLEPMSMGP